MSTSYSTKNYTKQGGNETVIGGKVTVKAGAEVDIESGGTIKGLPVAASNKLGAVKVGAGLNVTSAGVLSAAAATTESAGAVKAAANQAASTAEDVAGLKADFNTLLAALKTAGVIAPDPAAE